MKHLANALWFLGYLAVMASGLWALHRANGWALESYSAAGEEGQQRQADWDEWRQEAAEQFEGKGPVKRRIPGSAEPPTLVLLRDYYGMCVTAFALFGSVLYGTFMFLVRGMIASPGRITN